MGHPSPRRRNAQDELARQIFVINNPSAGNDLTTRTQFNVDQEATESRRLLTEGNERRRLGGLEDRRFRKTKLSKLRQNTRGSRSFRSTILTGASGLLDAAPASSSGLKTLLGQ